MFILLFLMALSVITRSSVNTEKKQIGSTESEEHVDECCKELILKYKRSTMYQNRNHFKSYKEITEETCKKKISKQLKKANVNATNEYLQICTECYGKTIAPEDPLLLMNFNPEQRLKLLYALELYPESTNVDIMNRNIKYILRLPNDNDQSNNIIWWQNNLGEFSSEEVFEILYCQNLFKYQKYCVKEQHTLEIYGSTIDNCSYKYVKWVLQPFCDENQSGTPMRLSSSDFLMLLTSSMKNKSNTRKTVIKKVVGNGLRVGLTIFQMRIILASIDNDVLNSIDDFTAQENQPDWTMSDSMNVIKQKCNYSKLQREELLRSVAYCSCGWIWMVYYAQRYGIRKDIVLPLLNTYEGDSFPVIDSILKAFKSSIHQSTADQPNKECKIDVGTVMKFFLIAYWDLQKDDQTIQEKINSLLVKYLADEEECTEFSKKVNSSLQSYLKQCGEKKYDKGDCKKKSDEMWKNITGEELNSRYEEKF